ncbi:MAG TPA: acetoacetate--CoA ligase [Gemmatimonadaceae bacterium]|jgi:acetoacetyl-CoA synthetase|nr:acetoacetate--CoA ligase [Gemmatimonadaceae bacterium]
MTAPLWRPSADRIARSALARFMASVSVDGGYDAIYKWSIAQPAAFWDAVWSFGGVIGDRDPSAPVVVGLDRMSPPDPVLGPKWFPSARLNYAENLLRGAGDDVALIAWTEDGPRRTLTYGELRAEVGAVAGALLAHGVRAGDRVAGFLPNCPEAVIAMLATASIGALWSSCSPDFGVTGVVDRFGQIAPKVLFCVDGYKYNGKSIDLLDRAAEVRSQLPGLVQTVVIPYRHRSVDLAPIRGATTWHEFVSRAYGEPLVCTRLPFDHPLYVLYSSGTTGLPKCIVHGAGGTLLQHIKELALHTDVGPGDRVFYFTTTGWMMWNWVVSALAVGATVVLYDGSPLPNAQPGLLWDMAAREGVTVFGTSAKYLALAQKQDVAPARTHDLGQLRTILSTGSPLAEYSYDYVYEAVHPDVCLSSISGGTDIVSCFALGNPLGPVWRGELQALGLGMRVEVWDQHGRPTTEAGELVCTMPFPSMPVGFWNDPDGARYRAAYFETFPGAWRHGDWAQATEHGGLVIHGRSDTTLNPGGVRIGTAEIYRVVEQFPEVAESVVVGQTMRDGDCRTVLFVRLTPGVTMDDDLRHRLRTAIREQASPHHVPHVIVPVADIPRTVSGKIAEMAVRDVLHGRPVANASALANPDALALYQPPA